MHNYFVIKSQEGGRASVSHFIASQSVSCWKGVKRMINVGGLEGGIYSSLCAMLIPLATQFYYCHVWSAAFQDEEKEEEEGRDCQKLIPGNVLLYLGVRLVVVLCCCIEVVVLVDWMRVYCNYSSCNLVQNVLCSSVRRAPLLYPFTGQMICPTWNINYDDETRVWERDYRYILMSLGTSGFHYI